MFGLTIVIFRIRTVRWIPRNVKSKQTRIQPKNRIIFHINYYSFNPYRSCSFYRTIDIKRNVLEFFLFTVSLTRLREATSFLYASNGQTTGDVGRSPYEIYDGQNTYKDDTCEFPMLFPKLRLLSRPISRYCENECTRVERKINKSLTSRKKYEDWFGKNQRRPSRLDCKEKHDRNKISTKTFSFIRLCKFNEPRGLSRFSHKCRYG